MSYLERWDELSTFTCDAPSGMHYVGRYVDMDRVLAAGYFDFSILANLDALDSAQASSNGEAKTAIAEGLRYKRWVVMNCLEMIDGEAVELTEELYDRMPVNDRTVFFQMATRQEAPKAEV